MRKLLIVFSLAMIVVLLATTALTASAKKATSIPDILINEIMPNPNSVPDTDGEWVELYNNSKTAVDINGWTIKDDDFDSHLIDNGGPLIIPAFGYIVLGINADETENGGVLVDYEYEYEWGNRFYMSNSGDEVVLENADGVEIDRMSYSSSLERRGQSLYMHLEYEGTKYWKRSEVIKFNDYDYGTPGGPNEHIISSASDTGSAIEALVDSNLLNEGQGNALIAKLEGALEKISEGSTIAGINQLEALINQLEALVQTGKLSEEEAQPLFDMISDLLTILGQLDGEVVSGPGGGL
ncbi:lamin tail domain-containing protein [Chloroflexota bacterium]